MASWQRLAPAAVPGPGAPQGVPSTMQNRHNNGFKDQHAGRIAGSCAAQQPLLVLWEDKYVKAALSPLLHQVYLCNKFLELTSRMKLFSCSPGCSSSLSPALRLHLLWVDETSPSGQPKQQPQLQQSKIMKCGPPRSHPPAMGWVDRAPSPGWSCLPPGPQANVSPQPWPTWTLSFREGHS